MTGACMDMRGSPYARVPSCRWEHRLCAKPKLSGHGVDISARQITTVIFDKLSVDKQEALVVGTWRSNGQDLSKVTHLSDRTRLTRSWQSERALWQQLGREWKTIASMVRFLWIEHFDWAKEGSLCALRASEGCVESNQAPDRVFQTASES